MTHPTEAEIREAIKRIDGLLSIEFCANNIEEAVALHLSRHILTHTLTHGLAMEESEMVKIMEQWLKEIALKHMDAENELNHLEIAKGRVYKLASALVKKQKEMMK